VASLQKEYIKAGLAAKPNFRFKSPPKRQIVKHVLPPRKDIKRSFMYSTRREKYAQVCEGVVYGTKEMGVFWIGFCGNIKAWLICALKALWNTLTCIQKRGLFLEGCTIRVVLDIGIRAWVLRFGPFFE
jgi:hypothetical protein